MNFESIGDLQDLSTLVLLRTRRRIGRLIVLLAAS